MSYCMAHAREAAHVGVLVDWRTREVSVLHRCDGKKGLYQYGEQHTGHDFTEKADDPAAVLAKVGLTFALEVGET